MGDNDIREQLGDITGRVLAELQREWGDTPGIPTPAVAVNRMADALTAEGWQPRARVIETTEELDALPAGTIILNRHSAAAWKVDGRWATPGDAIRHRADWIDLPATVLYEPEEGRDA